MPKGIVWGLAYTKGLIRMVGRHWQGRFKGLGQAQRHWIMSGSHWRGLQKQIGRTSELFGRPWSLLWGSLCGGTTRISLVMAIATKG